jgi:hypothetical protein
VLKFYDHDRKILTAKGNKPSDFRKLMKDLEDKYK